MNKDRSIFIGRWPYVMEERRTYFS